MKPSKLLLAAAALLVTVLWLATDNIFARPPALFPLRESLREYTGLLAMTAMSLAMILAMRPSVLEGPLGGLDKMYRLHKWLGIGSVIMVGIHYLWVKGPKWLVGLGLVERPARGPRPQMTDPLLAALQSMRHLAEEVGEWGLYALLVLAGIALWKRFPYRRFVSTHRLMALLYLAMVFHGVVLMKPADWSQPLGWVMAALMAAGSVGAILSLTGRIGAGRRASGRIASLIRHPDSRVTEVTVALDERWNGHRSGQFAFVTFDSTEGAHPFTIASDWRGDGRLTFLIKDLGDYTARLSGALKVGDDVRVEGPYGRFDFSGTPRRQIWIGGGIGITPFIARLKALATQRDGRAIDLFYSTAADDNIFLGAIEAQAKAAGTRLHVVRSPQDGLLTGERVRAAVPDWRQADIWFCGPKAFADALRADFAAHGLAPARFHQELFEMR